MEMSWMETFQLLGLDVVAVVLMALVALMVIEHAVHSAWGTARGRRPRATGAVARSQLRVGGVSTSDSAAPYREATAWGSRVAGFAPELMEFALKPRG